MNLTKQKLVNSIERRLRKEVSVRNPVKFLKNLDALKMADIAIEIVYLFTRNVRNEKQTILAEVIAGIGHEVRNKHKIKRDSALAAKAGAFLLYSFEELGILYVKLGRGANAHGQYIVEVINEEALTNLWSEVTIQKTEKLPSETPYAPWISSHHDIGISLVKTNSKLVLDAVTPETHPIVFNVVNKAQEVGWQINEEVYELQLWALRNKTDAFAEIWDQQNPTAKQSKLREAKAISEIARRFIGKTFYHLYSLDFRGRKYPTTAYLHEQGSDLAKGLLLEAKGKPITKQGFVWLMISIANNWAGDAGREDGLKTDKIPLNDRLYWAMDNEEILLSYAENPKVNQGWMEADSPWQFIAACFELKNFRNWQASFFDDWVNPDEIENELEKMNIEPYGYVTCLDGFIDGL